MELMIGEAAAVFKRSNPTVKRADGTALTAQDVYDLLDAGAAYFFPLLCVVPF